MRGKRRRDAEQECDKPDINMFWGSNANLKKVQERRLKWYGQVVQRENPYVARIAMGIGGRDEVAGGRVRPCYTQVYIIILHTGVHHHTSTTHKMETKMNMKTNKESHTEQESDVHDIDRVAGAHVWGW